MAKDHWFGHWGSLVERCVFFKERELLEFLLAKGAEDEEVERPILEYAKLTGAGDDIEALLIKYGARWYQEEDAA